MVGATSGEGFLVSYVQMHAYAVLVSVYDGR